MRPVRLDPLGYGRTLAQSDWYRASVPNGGVLIRYFPEDQRGVHTDLKTGAVTERRIRIRAA